MILTSDEANEAFERAFLQARHEVWAAFNRLDPDLALISPAGTRIGETWSALIAATLERGVKLHIFLPDPDAFAAPAAHRANHACARRLQALAESRGLADRLELRVLPHPARARALAAHARWPARRALAEAELKRLAQMDPEARAEALRDMPGLTPYLTGLGTDRPALRAMARPPLAAAGHHHQMLVADRHMLLLGGPDIAPSRHAYGLRILREGPPAADAQTHLERFSEITAGTAEPGSQRHLLRTLSCPSGRLRRRPTHTLRHDIATAHTALARRAEDLIYIETRALTDPELITALAAAGRDRADLGLIVMLPGGAPQDPAEQRRALAQLRRAFGPRFFAGQGKVAFCEGGQRLALFDKRAALVTSADLSPGALHRDTEAGLYVRTPREVNEIGSRAMSYWLSMQRTAAPMPGPERVALWRARAEQSDARMRPYPVD